MWFFHGGTEQWQSLVADAVIEIFKHNLDLNFPSP
jgi:hypothetical protein